MPHDSEQHAQHDPLVVVSLAAGDLTGADRDLAASQIAACGECATLHDDLLAIARATSALPAAARSRDFRLTPEQAARLRPAGWRRFVAAFASPRLAVTRQLGVGLTTLGLAGLLVSVLPGIPLGMGGSAAAPAPRDQVLSSTDQGGAGAESAASAAPAAGATTREPNTVSNGGPSATYGVVAPVSNDGSGRASASGDQRAEGDTTAQAPDVAKSAAAEQRDLLFGQSAEESGVSLFLVASAILLAAGIALLVVRRIARGVGGG